MVNHVNIDIKLRYSVACGVVNEINFVGLFENVNQRNAGKQ